MSNKAPILTASRILDGSRVAQAADDTPVTGWPTTDPFIIVFQIDEGAGPWTANYRVDWQDDTDGSGYTELVTSGELIRGPGTVLTDGGAVTSGERACTATGGGGSTWQDGLELDGSSQTGSYQILDEYYTEFHVVVDPQNADYHTYSFRLYDATDGAEIDIAAATITFAAPPNPRRVFIIS